MPRPTSEAALRGGAHRAGALLVLRYPLSYRDIKELYPERSGGRPLHSTLNRLGAAYAPLIDKRLRKFRRPHRGSVWIDETYITVRGQWRYCTGHRQHGEAVDFLLTAQRDLDAVNRFFRKMLQDQPLLTPDRSAPMELVRTRAKSPRAASSTALASQRPQSRTIFVQSRPLAALAPEH